MEATPHYFHGGARLVSALMEICPETRIILTLRDPVDRLWSIYRFAKSMLQLRAELTISEFVATAHQIYRDEERQTVENRPFWTSISGSMYSRFMQPWLELVPRDRLKLVFFEDVAASPQRVVRDLCAWLGVDTHVEGYSYDIQNRSVAYRNRRLHQLALFVNGERLLRNHRAVKKPLRSLYYRLNGCAPAEEMGEEIRRELSQIFSHSNAQLAAQLSYAGFPELPTWLTHAVVGT